MAKRRPGSFSGEAPLEARPRRLRVRYERAGRSLYSAAAAGGAKMTRPILAGGPLEAQDALKALIPA